MVSNRPLVRTQCVIFSARKRIFSYIFNYERELSTKSTEFSTKHGFFQRQSDPEITVSENFSFLSVVLKIKQNLKLRQSWFVDIYTTKAAKNVKMDACYEP